MRRSARWARSCSAIPAIANAIYDAVGVRITSLPATAEKVFKALQAKREQQPKQIGTGASPNGGAAGNTAVQ